MRSPSSGLTEWRLRGYSHHPYVHFSTSIDSHALLPSAVGKVLKYSTSLVSIGISRASEFLPSNRSSPQRLAHIPSAYQERTGLLRSNFLFAPEPLDQIKYRDRLGFERRLKNWATMTY